MMYAALIILGAVLLLLISACFIFSGLVIYPRIVSYEEALEREIENGRIDEEAFSSMKKEVVTIDSTYGYKLYGWYFPHECPDGKHSNKTVIICHGITYNVYGSVKYMDMFTKHGFNVLMYDHRHHGKSGGNNTTFGYYEKVDLSAWIDWLYNRYGSSITVGTMGESMGAAIILQNAAIDKRVAFCIADCPFSDLIKLLKIRLRKDFHLPPFLFLHITNLMIFLRTGMSLWKVSPIKDAAKIDIPVFFAHGAHDDYVPPQMSRDMYEVKKGIKKLYISPNAGHAKAYWTNREEYTRQVEGFLDEIGLL